jgi:hypothetical protein
MQKKSVNVHPLLENGLSAGVEAVAQLLHSHLLSHQTVTLLFEDPSANTDPKDMPALLVSRLPSEDWVLEIPLPPITSKQDLGSRVNFFIFNDWNGPAEEIAGSFSSGPKKLVHEPDSRSLTTAMLSAVEDLLLIADQMEVSQILIADKNGEISESLAKTWTRFFAANSKNVNLLPAGSEFFKHSVFEDGFSRNESREAIKQLFRLTALLDRKKIIFFATTCYMGLPRNLFALDCSGNNPIVLVWNGQNFVTCNEVHINHAIQNNCKPLQPGGPQELPPIFVSDLWPEALAKLGLPTVDVEEAE